MTSFSSPFFVLAFSFFSSVFFLSLSSVEGKHLLSQKLSQKEEGQEVVVPTRIRGSSSSSTTTTKAMAKTKAETTTTGSSETQEEVAVVTTTAGKGKEEAKPRATATAATEAEEATKDILVTDNESALSGSDFLNGIREIIGRDGLLSENDLQYKPFMGSFANIKSDNDPNFKGTAYCMTDNHCGHFEAYSESTVPLADLACNKFCYIDSNTNYYATSQVYTIQNPPETYLCCGWETCG